MNFRKRCLEEKNITLLGEGSFGDVYRCSDIAEKRFKFFYNSKLGVEVSFINEIFITNELNHPNIINILGTYIILDKAYMYTKYANNTLRKMIDSNNIDPEILPEWINQIVSGIKYLHQKDITHNDIKPDNIFIYDNVIKLADFGLSSYVVSIDSEIEINIIYGPPEIIITDNPLPFTTDMWQLGVTILEMKTKLRPFDVDIRDPRDIKFDLANLMFDFLGSPSDDMINQICDTEILEEIEIRDNDGWFPEKENILKEMGKELVLIDKLLVWDPETRYNITELSKLNYFTTFKTNSYTTSSTSNITTSSSTRSSNILLASTIITISPSYFLGIRFYDQCSLIGDEVSTILICFHLAAIMFEPSHNSWKRAKKIITLDNKVWMSKISVILEKLEYRDIKSEGDILYHLYNIERINFTSTLKVSLWILSTVYLDLILFKVITKTDLLQIIILSSIITNDWITIQNLGSVISSNILKELLSNIKKYGTSSKYHINLTKDILLDYDIDVLMLVKNLTVSSIERQILNMEKNIKRVSRWTYTEFSEYFEDLDFSLDKIHNLWKDYQNFHLSYEIFHF